MSLVIEGQQFWATKYNIVLRIQKLQALPFRDVGGGVLNRSLTWSGRALAATPATWPCKKAVYERRQSAEATSEGQEHQPDDSALGNAGKGLKDWDSPMGQTK